MKKIIKIGFTGTREGLNEFQKSRILELFYKYIDHHIDIYHGDCIGADTDFHKLCLDFKKNKNVELVITIMPPDKDIMRGFNKGDIIMTPKPYLKRNDDILLNSDIVIGCPLDKSNEVMRSGTWSTIRKAKKMNKELHIF
jgi:hypothetical protein